MFRPFPLFVGLRYFRAKRRNQFISFISVMSLVSIAIGVMALITVLSVMNGFQNELRDRIRLRKQAAGLAGSDAEARAPTPRGGRRALRGEPGDARQRPQQERHRS